MKTISYPLYAIVELPAKRPFGDAGKAGDKSAKKSCYIATTENIAVEFTKNNERVDYKPLNSDSELIQWLQTALEHSWKTILWHPSGQRHMDSIVTLLSELGVSVRVDDDDDEADDFDEDDFDEDFDDDDEYDDDDDD